MRRHLQTLRPRMPRNNQPQVIPPKGNPMERRIRQPERRGHGLDDRQVLESHPQHEDRRINTLRHSSKRHTPQNILIRTTN